MRCERSCWTKGSISTESSFQCGSWWHTGGLTLSKLQLKWPSLSSLFEWWRADDARAARKVLRQSWLLYLYQSHTDCGFKTNWKKGKHWHLYLQTLDRWKDICSYGTPNTSQTYVANVYYLIPLIFSPSLSVGSRYVSIWCVLRSFNTAHWLLCIGCKCCIVH